MGKVVNVYTKFKDLSIKFLEFTNVKIIPVDEMSEAKEIENENEESTYRRLKKK